MKTDDLITMLSTNVEPVDTRQVTHTIRKALLIAGAAVVIAVLLALGVRDDAMNSGALAALVLKLGATLVVLALASRYLIKVARPGGERQVPLVWIVAPFVGIMMLAVLSLGSAPHAHWHGMILGDQWLECIISIPVIAVVPFAVLVWAVRQAAPTDLRRTGAVVGLVAGSLSAAGYAFHCMDDSVPFVALWYGGTILLCSVVGWALGPRLLRW
jgi:hypothetical protein